MTRTRVPKGTALEARLDYWIEVEGDCWIWKGNVFDGYGKIKYQGKDRRVHRVVYELVSGEPIPEGMVVNHRCGQRACCRPEHLELVTVQQNNQYLTVLSSHNTSGYRGVAWHRVHGKWYAYVQANGKNMSLGYFDTAEEANEAAIAGRAKYHSVPEFSAWRDAA